VLLGDSHIAYFAFAADVGYFGKRQYAVCEVPGATAVGLRNPNSQTNALRTFSEFLNRANKRAIVIIQLGEVDCGFVIWYRNQKYQDGVEKQFEESINAYFSFVDGIIARGFRKIIITGATVPTIQDGHTVGEVANARREVKASLLARTRLTLQYNEMLSAQAKLRGLPFADISNEVLDPKTGVVQRYYLNRRRIDHHMRLSRAARCWARQIETILRHSAWRD
jgi:hypothetical protein